MPSPCCLNTAHPASLTAFLIKAKHIWILLPELLASMLHSSEIIRVYGCFPEREVGDGRQFRELVLSVNSKIQVGRASLLLTVD
jgi:hypothetical protein